MLGCQLLHFDQKLGCHSLSHQFQMKVFGLQYTPAMHVAQKIVFISIHNTLSRYSLKEFFIYPRK